MHFLPVLLAAFSKCPISYCSALDSCLDPASQPAALLHLEMKDENSFKIELLSIPYCEMCEKYHFIDKLVNFTGCFWSWVVSLWRFSLNVFVFVFLLVSSSIWPNVRVTSFSECWPGHTFKGKHFQLKFFGWNHKKRSRTHTPTLTFFWFNSQKHIKNIKQGAAKWPGGIRKV